jgi:serine protease Do
MRTSRTLSGFGILLAVCLALPATARPACAQADTTILPPAEIGTLHVGQTVRGRLEPGDHAMGDGTWADVWYFDGVAGQRVQIDLRSRAFDAYLQLLDAAGNVLNDNDDGAGGKDSRITVTLRTGQRYQIVANTYGDSPRPGVYTISLAVLPPGR